jgi:hypothetical protein
LQFSFAGAKVALFLELPKLFEGKFQKTTKKGKKRKVSVQKPFQYSGIWT